MTHVCHEKIDGAECRRPAHYALQDPTRSSSKGAKGSTTTRLVCDLHAIMALLTTRSTVELFRAARTSQPLSGAALKVKSYTAELIVELGGELVGGWAPRDSASGY